MLSFQLAKLFILNATAGSLKKKKNQHENCFNSAMLESCDLHFKTEGMQSARRFSENESSLVITVPNRINQQRFIRLF